MFKSIVKRTLSWPRVWGAPLRCSTPQSQCAHLTLQNLSTQKTLAPKISQSTMKAFKKLHKLKRILYQYRSLTIPRMGEWIGRNTSFRLQISNFISRRRHIFLNESNYDMNPAVFSTFVAPDLMLSVRNDGIQHCATYNPPGPTTPGGGTLSSPNGVWFVSSLILFTQVG